MRALPVLLLGLCAAVVAVVAWPSPEDPPPAPPHRAAEVPAPGTAGPSGTDPAPVAASTALDDPAAPDEQPDEIRVDAAGPEDPRGPQVAVVRGTPPVPVAGAAVYFVTEADAADRDRRNGGGSSRHEWPERFGQRLGTDAEGTVVLPPKRQPWLVAAVSGGEFAFGTVPPGPRSVTLVLVADELVTVLARDVDGGNASGLPVALLLHRELLVPGIMNAVHDFHAHCASLARVA